MDNRLLGDGKVVSGRGDRMPRKWRREFVEDRVFARGN
jgi:hypothetical protein